MSRPPEISVDFGGGRAALGSSLRGVSFPFGVASGPVARTISDAGSPKPPSRNIERVAAIGGNQE